MNRFSDDLCFYCTERMKPPTTAEYKKLLAEAMALDDELQRLTGWDFLNRYQNAIDKLYDCRLNAYFLEGLKFGVRFMLTVFPPHDSSNTSIS